MTAPTQSSITPSFFVACPVTGVKGKVVKMVTLKALLQPRALAKIEPDSTYRFCPDPSCDVVYFSEAQLYYTSDIKVSVFQKDESSDVPVCYCFGHSRADVLFSVANGSDLEASIVGHIKARRCGCEVNNPQGSCCLSNVKTLIGQRKI